MSELRFPCVLSIKKDDVTGVILIACAACEIGTAVTPERYRHVPNAAEEIGTVTARLMGRVTCHRSRAP